MTEAVTFDGRYSLHEYEFLAKEPSSAHDNGAHVQCKWSVAWPAEGSGLHANGLKSLQKLVISKCFGGEDVSTIGEAEANYKRRARHCFGPEHYRQNGYKSQWEFYAKGELTWPFGKEWKSGKWYQRPVIVFKNEGSDNDGGSGCHEHVYGFIVSIPDGTLLNEHDYFREDVLDTLAEMVGQRLLQKYEEEVAFKQAPKVRSGEDCWLTLSADGMTWWIRPYSLFCGAVGVTNVTIPWEELEPFSRQTAGNTLAP